jgi:hypothetical protein
MKPNLLHPPDAKRTPQKVPWISIEPSPWRTSEVHGPRRQQEHALTGVGPINKGPQREEIIGAQLMVMSTCRKPACPLAPLNRLKLTGLLLRPTSTVTVTVIHFRRFRYVSDSQHSCRGRRSIGHTAFKAVRCFTISMARRPRRYCASGGHSMRLFNEAIQ